MDLFRSFVAALMLASCFGAVSADELPPFSVEAGDGLVLFENVTLRDSGQAGGTLFNAVAVNRSGCDFRVIDIDLVFVAGVGDHVKRVTIENFRDGASVPLSDRRIPDPRQEVQSIRGISMPGARVCAKAVAEEKAARERERQAAATRLEREVEARKKEEAARAARIAAVKAKPFKAGIGGLSLGMSREDLLTLSQDNTFPWRPLSPNDKTMVLECKPGFRCNLEPGGPGESGKKGCEVRRVLVDFANGKSVTLNFQSPPCPVARVNADLKKWGDSALGEMRSIYGKPTAVPKPFAKIGAGDFRTGKATPFASWTRKNETVRLSGTILDDEYRMNLTMEEPAGRKERAKDRDRGRR